MLGEDKQGPLKARWVDIDKGTRYRSRWLAKQFKGSDSEEWFAATPPIEALRALTDFTHHEWYQKESIDGVRRLSSEPSSTLQCNTRKTWSCVRRR